MTALSEDLTRPHRHKLLAGMLPARRPELHHRNGLSARHQGPRQRVTVDEAQAAAQEARPEVGLEGQRHGLEHRMRDPKVLSAGGAAGRRDAPRHRPAASWALRAGAGVMLARAVLLLGALALALAGQPSRAQSRPAWLTPAVAAPGVSYQSFDSPAAGTRVSYHLYTPAAYARDDGRRYPVVYWLHGSGGGLSGIAPVARHFDAAIASGEIPPLLVVFVNGLRMGMYVDWKDGSAPVETVIVRDLVKHIDATYRTVASREGRLLDGFSMGGYGAARFGFKYPELFRTVSIVGAGPMQETLSSTPRASGRQAADLLREVYGGDPAHFLSVSPRRLAAQNAARLSRDSTIRVVIGERDETFRNNLEFHEHLKGLGIPHEWIVLKDLGHDPLAVMQALGDRNWAFYRAAFR